MAYNGKKKSCNGHGDSSLSSFFSRVGQAVEKNFVKAEQAVEKNVINFLDHTSSRPLASAGFFENYERHLVQLAKNVQDDIQSDLLDKDTFNIGRLAISYAWFTGKHNQTDRPFIDRYDVADELLGAFIMPIIQEAIGFALLGYALYELGCSLAITACFKSNDDIDHRHVALLAIGAALLCFANSFIYSMVSTINLFSRSLLTAIDGYQKPKSDRFYTGSLEAVLDDLNPFTQNSL